MQKVPSLSDLSDQETSGELIYLTHKYLKKCIEILPPIPKNLLSVSYHDYFFFHLKHFIADYDI